MDFLWVIGRDDRYYNWGYVRAYSFWVDRCSLEHDNRMELENGD